MIVVLYITSWRGISFNAEHYYGKLIKVESEKINIENVHDWSLRGFDDVELKKKLTQKEAEELNEKDSYLGSRYEEGYESNRFNSIKEVTEAGIKAFKEMELKCDFVSLLEGDRFSGTVEIKQ